MASKRESRKKTLQPAPTPSFIGNVNAYLTISKKFVEVQINSNSRIDLSRRMYLVDEVSGKVAPLLRTSKLGRFVFQTLNHNSMIYALFENPDNILHEDSLVTLTIGTLRKEHLRIKSYSP